MSGGSTGSFPATLRRLVKTLETDGDFVTALEQFTAAYDPSKHFALIQKNAPFIKKCRILDLVLEKVLPASFSELFLSMLRILAVVDNYEQEIYAADAVGKIVYSMKENHNNATTQILGCKLLAYLAQDEAVREALGEEADLIQQLINILISCIANVYNDATLRVLCSCLLALTNLAFDSDNNKLAIVKIGGEILAKLVPIYGQLEVTAFFLTMLLRNLVNSEETRELFAPHNLASKLAAVVVKFSGQKQIMKHTLWAMANLLCASEKNKRDVPLEALPHLVEFLKDTNTPEASELAHSASIILLQLCRLATYRKALVSDEKIDVIGTVVELIKANTDNEGPKLLIPLQLLDRLCVDSTARAMLAEKHSSGIITVINVLNAHAADAAVHQCGVRLFARLLGLSDKSSGEGSALSASNKVGLQTRDILKENRGITTLVASMNAHDSVENLKTRVVKILNALFSTPTAASTESDSVESGESKEESTVSKDSDEEEKDESGSASSGSDDESSASEEGEEDENDGMVIITPDNMFILEDLHGEDSPDPSSPKQRDGETNEELSEPTISTSSEPTTSDENMQDANPVEQTNSMPEESENIKTNQALEDETLTSEPQQPEQTDLSEKTTDASADLNASETKVQDDITVGESTNVPPQTSEIKQPETDKPPEKTVDNQADNTESATEMEPKAEETALKPEEIAPESEEAISKPDEGATKLDVGDTTPEVEAAKPNEGTTTQDAGATIPEDGTTKAEESATKGEESATKAEEVEPKEEHVQKLEESTPASIKDLPKLEEQTAQLEDSSQQAEETVQNAKDNNEEVSPVKESGQEAAIPTNEVSSTSVDSPEPRLTQSADSFVRSRSFGDIHKYSRPPYRSPSFSSFSSLSVSTTRSSTTQSSPKSYASTTYSSSSSRTSSYSLHRSTNSIRESASSSASPGRSPSRERSLSLSADMTEREARRNSPLRDTSSSYAGETYRGVKLLRDRFNALAQSSASDTSRSWRSSSSGYTSGSYLSPTSISTRYSSSSTATSSSSSTRSSPRRAPSRSFTAGDSSVRIRTSSASSTTTSSLPYSSSTRAVSPSYRERIRNAFSFWSNTASASTSSTSSRSTTSSYSSSDQTSTSRRGSYSRSYTYSGR